MMITRVKPAVPEAALSACGQGISVAEAMTRVRAAAVTPSQTIALGRAMNRVLAQPVMAVRDQPPFDAAAMDGYAVGDGMGPFTVIGESVAGRRFAGKVDAGEAVRIFTGGAVPDGAVRVIMQEHARRDGNRLLWLGTAADKTNIRPRGQDFHAGEAVLTAGRRLDPWALALTAAAGRGQAVVRVKPRIAVLCNGNELVPPGQAPHDDQVFDCVSFAMLGLIEQWGGTADLLGIAPDNPRAIAEAVAAVKADLIVTVGGASKGDHDYVKQAMADYRLDLAFASVNMRPGKPVWFGSLADGMPVLGLPGNPGAAFVGAQLFLKAFIEAALGMPPSEPEMARLTHDLPANGPRETFLRAVAVDGEVAPHGSQDSSLVAAFARSNALIYRPGSDGRRRAGDEVTILRLRM